MKVKRLQEGGQVAPQGGGAEEQVAQMAQQIIQQLGPEAAAMLAQMILEMLQGAGGQEAQGEPMYARKGGKLVLIGRK
jgi:protein subunit release factor A